MDSIDQLINEHVEQKSDLWDKVRRGKFTSSESHKIIDNGKRPMTDSELEAAKANKGKAKTIEDESLFTDGGETYIISKVAEVLTGESPAEVNTLATAWGNEYEPLARDLFVKRTGIEVELVGFCQYTDHSGGSPDGCTLNAEGARDGIIEIKCPYNSTNHVQHLLIESQEYFKQYFKEYYWQMQANMMFTGTSKGWFISFDPRMKESELFMILIKSDIADFNLLDKKIKAATEKKIQLLKQIKEKTSCKSQEQ